MRRPFDRAQGGFTLLELLITLAVTVIGLTGLLSLFVVTAKGNSTTSRSGEAVAVAEATLEEARTLSVAAMNAQYGNFPIDVNLNTVAGRAGVTFNRRLQITEMTSTSTNLLKLRVEVTWTDAGAAAGANGGLHDHRISFELIRTGTEGL